MFVLSMIWIFGQEILNDFALKSAGLVQLM